MNVEPPLVPPLGMLPVGTYLNSSVAQMMIRSLRVAKSLMLPVLLACGNDSKPEAPHSPATTVAISADQLQNPRKLALTELHRLGGPADGVGYTFGRFISSAALAHDGTLYVADAFDAVIAVFDTAGTLIRRIGRAGDGPGEFSGEMSIHITIAADTLFAVERKLHAFSLDGKLLNTTPMGPQYGVVSFARTTEGLLLASTYSRRDGDRDAAFEIDSILVQRYSEVNEAFDTATVRLAGLKTYRFGTLFSRELFGVQPAVAVMPGHSLLYVSTHRYEIAILSPDDGERGMIRGDIPPAAVSAIELNAARETILASAHQAPPGEHLRNVEEAARTVPAAQFKPLLGRLVAGYDDLLMVERPSPTFLLNSRSSPSNWDVIDIVKGFVGQLTLPPGQAPIVLATGTLIAQGYTSQGDPIVYRYSFAVE